MIDMAVTPDPWTLGVPPRNASPSNPLDLSGGESPLGCSPYAARRAIEAVGSTTSAWRDALLTLRAAISRKYSVSEDRISLGAGCRVLLPALLRAFAGVGGKVAVAAPAPPLHRLALAQAGAKVVEIPLGAGFGHDIEAWAAVLRQERPQVALLGHPLNPSGRFFLREELLSLIEAAGDTLLVIDEAYADYADKPEFARLAPILDEAPALVLVRSFSSLHGLAGLPTAYVLAAPETTERLAPALLGQEPGEVAARAATTAVAEPSFDVMVCDRLGRSRFKLAQGLREWGLAVEAGLVPWVMARVANGPDAVRRLAARGLRVRDLGFWGFEGWLRVRAGTDEETARFLEGARPVLQPR
jgi:histidinol-phosphate aminotransferase